MTRLTFAFGARSCATSRWRRSALALLTAGMLYGCADEEEPLDDQLGWPVTMGDAGDNGSGQLGGSYEAGLPGGYAGGSTAGASPGGSTGGLTGGNTGGLTGGNTGGLTGGNTGGLTGGITGGNAGGSTGATGGTAGGTAGGGDGPPESKLPQPKGACPDLKDGTLMVAGSSVKLWVGNKPGPVYFYFHGTGSNPDEVNQGLPGASAGVKSNGGLVASWSASSATGSSTGSFWTVWYTGDFDAADQILACAIQKGLVDTSRIHVAGYSAGGLQTGAMLFMRSNYVASGIIYSGGKGFGAMGLQDPSNAPAVLGAHGAKGSDALILDFSDWTQNAEKELKNLGGFAVDCDDGQGHVALSRLGVMGKAMQFLADHPYKKKPSPYASGLPSGFPSFCKVVQ